MFFFKGLGYIFSNIKTHIIYGSLGFHQYSQPTGGIVGVFFGNGRENKKKKKKEQITISEKAKAKYMLKAILEYPLVQPPNL